MGGGCMSMGGGILRASKRVSRRESGTGVWGSSMLGAGQARGEILASLCSWLSFRNRVWSWVAAKKRRMAW